MYCTWFCSFDILVLRRSRSVLISSMDWLNSSIIRLALLSSFLCRAPISLFLSVKLSFIDLNSCSDLPPMVVTTVSILSKLSWSLVIFDFDSSTKDFCSSVILPNSRLCLAESTPNSSSLLLNTSTALSKSCLDLLENDLCMLDSSLSRSVWPDNTFSVLSVLLTNSVCWVLILEISIIMVSSTFLMLVTCTLLYSFSVMKSFLSESTSDLWSAVNLVNTSFSLVN